MALRSARLAPAFLGTLMASAMAAYGCGGSADVELADPDGGGAGDGGNTTSSPPPEGGADDGASGDADASGDAGDDGDAALSDAGDAGDADAGDADAPPPGPLSPSYVDFDINHVLVTGQSNAVSNAGWPILTTTQPYTNLMFDTGVMPMWGRPGNNNTACNGAGCTVFQTPSALLPLVEGDKFLDANWGRETSASALANQASYLALNRFEFGVRAGYPQKHDILMSIHGRSGNTYWCLRKPVPPVAGAWNHSICNYRDAYLAPFTQGMMEVESAKALAAAAGKSYVVRAVATIHGESDDYSWANGGWEFPLAAHDGTPNEIKDYADGLIEWQDDYETSIKAITGQSVPVPLLVSQTSGWNYGAYSRVAHDQLRAHVLAPGKVILIGPSYFMQLNQSDCNHFTSEGVRTLGEYFAKVYAHVVLGGQTWEPLRPRTVTRAGNVITARFHVPKPPLVIDTTRVAAAASYGFSFRDSTGAAAPQITGVAITGPDTVQITLAATPTGTNQRLQYAMNQVPNTCIGTPNGARGNLRDSDDTPSRLGKSLHNWAVHFDEAVQ
jgi:hypothetical protein